MKPTCNRFFSHTCGYQLTSNEIFCSGCGCRRRALICLNQVTAKMTLEENNLSIGLIIKQYVYFWKSSMEFNSV